MTQGIQFTQYVPTSLVGVDSPSPTLAAEVVTGMPISTGAFPGNCFYLTEQQANQLSATSVNGAPVLQCHAGWYMVVQVDSGATAGNIAQGYIGAQAVLGSPSVAVPPQALVTDASHWLAPGINPCVFLNAVTPGNFTIVQLAGDASVFVKAAQTGIVAGAHAIAVAGDDGQVTINAAAITPTLLAETVGLVEAQAPAGGLVRVNVAFPFGSI